MKKEELKQILEDQVFILDGATGTELQRYGMPEGVCPEQWVLQNPEIFIDIQKKYIESGTQGLYTCTFGANRIKLQQFGLERDVVSMNRILAQLSRQAAGSKGWVIGDLAPTGVYIEPIGEYSFEEIVDVYKEQVKGLLQGGVDAFVIETMMNIQEARAALLAVKESCDLPVWVSMTFEENEKTLTGTDPVTALITLQNLGADAVGCNCSTGPKEMISLIKQMKPYATVPLLAKPNAGLPRFIDGQTVFSMKQEEFAQCASQLIKAGVNIVGGCCGTTPSYISMMSSKLKTSKPIPPKTKQGSVITSARDTLWIGKNQPLQVIGERINPTGKKKLQEQLRQGQLDLLRKFALEQVAQGATILDVNLGMSNIDEVAMMKQAINLLANIVQVPLCIDSSSPEVIEAALRIYPGRALLNSISLETEKIGKLLPIAAKYGAMFILLPVSDIGIPSTWEEKKKIIEEIYQRAEVYGYEKEDFLIDGLVMALSAHPSAAIEVFETIEWSQKEFGSNTTIGLSNISFGLPERQWINTAFLCMAMEKGLTTAIANPANEIFMNLKKAGEVLLGKDENSKGYVKYFGSKVKQESPIVLSTDNEKGIGEQIYQGVLEGEKDRIISLLDKAIKKGMKPKNIVEEYLIPGITKVGELFEEQIYFLPQLIMSGETMKEAFAYLEPLLQEDSVEGYEKPKVILATVQGDIHDIGKNIVGLMLQNHGFDVIDLGKDVKDDVILNSLKETKAPLLGLSALMTTTMVHMETVIDKIKEENINCKVMVGGAVVTEAYAQSIGADGYSKDANDAVRLAKRLVGMDQS
ncbi:MAG: dihydropteroate synthase [Epulopiscium sp.]|nr:dihydropteroate synthase [Candidatus Epulonipiscium sp.]